jgi:hypothetical protein
VMDFEGVHSNPMLRIATGLVEIAGSLVGVVRGWLDHQFSGNLDRLPGYRCQMRQQ